MFAVGALPVDAQVLQGKWVEEANAAIDRHRKTDLTVIVLDQQDRAVMGAKVLVTQQRHDFQLGLAIPADRKPPKDIDALPVYRCFNALSFERITDWADEDTPGNTATAGRLIHAWRSSIDPVRTVFGSVMSSDPARNDDDLLLLEPPAMRDVLLARVAYATSFEPKPDAYDLYGDFASQNMIERRLGGGMVHRLFDAADAKRPDAELSLRLRDAVSLRRSREAIAAVRRLEARQLPFDGVTIEQRFSRTIQPLPFKRMLDDSVGRLPVASTFAALEIGGQDPIAAAINTETFLRLAFAQPKVAGLYFAGLQEDEFVEKNAALLTAEGKPTASGRVLDALFTKTWWTKEDRVTNESGNANLRVFTGWYEIVVTLPDGRTMTTDVYVPKDDRPRLVVMQQTLAD